MSKVSVIIPYYNSRNTIIRALDSVLNQTYKDFEIIIVDDGSRDNTFQLVENYIREKNIISITKHIRQENKGPSAARNKGIRYSKGEYIAFLDSDDSWEKDKLKIQMEFIERHPNVEILGCDYKIVHNNSVKIKSKNIYEFKYVDFYKRLYKNYFCTPTVIIKKGALDFIGGFNENQKYAEDQLLFMQILRKYYGGKIQLPLVNIYKNEYGQSGLSSELNKLEKYELKNLKKMRKENYKYDKKVSILVYLSAFIFSIIKYIRRILTVKLRSKEK